MGTDKQGRDLLALVLQGGQISLMVGVISTLVSLVIGVSYGAVAGYLGGRIDNLMMRLVDVLYAVPYIVLVIVLLSLFKSQTARGQLTLLFVALGAVSWLHHGADRARASALAKESGICDGGESDWRFDSADHFPPHRS